MSTTPITAEEWAKRFCLLPQEEKDFVMRVCKGNGAKGAADPYFYEDNGGVHKALWKIPEALGLIVPSGSFRFDPTISYVQLIEALVKMYQDLLAAEQAKKP